MTFKIMTDWYEMSKLEYSQIFDECKDLLQIRSKELITECPKEESEIYQELSKFRENFIMKKILFPSIRDDKLEFHIIQNIEKVYKENVDIILDENDKLCKTHNQVLIKQLIDKYITIKPEFDVQDQLKNLKNYDELFEEYNTRSIGANKFQTLKKFINQIQPLNRSLFKDISQNYQEQYQSCKIIKKKYKKKSIEAGKYNESRELAIENYVKNISRYIDVDQDGDLSEIIPTLTEKIIKKHMENLEIDHKKNSCCGIF